MYRTNLKIDVNTNVCGTDGEDLVCNIFDDFVAQLSEFVEDEYDIFNTSINKQFFVKSEKSLIEKLPSVGRNLSKNLDLDETISNKFDYDTGRYDELEINIKYDEYNLQTFNQKTGEYTIKFTKNKHGKIIANTNHGSTECENKDIDELTNKRFIDVGELVSVDWFLNGLPEWEMDWQDHKKTKVNREALKYHGVDASNDQTYRVFIGAIRQITTDTDKIFSSLYQMLATTPLGKEAYKQYVKDCFETMLMLNPSETLACLNGAIHKIDLSKKNPSVTTWRPAEEEE